MAMSAQLLGSVVKSSRVPGPNADSAMIYFCNAVLQCPLSMFHSILFSEKEPILLISDEGKS